MRSNKQKSALGWFGLISLLYFAMGFLHIGFALSAFLCMGLPFILLYKMKRKSWCRYYCPRSYLLKTTGKWGRGSNPPIFLLSKGIRTGVIIYFGLNLFFMIMSTIATGLGKIEPMDFIRLFIAIPTGWSLPQLLDNAVLPPALVHLSYRFYSMMLSSTLAGVALGLLFKPKTWCVICPINTLSNKFVKVGNR